MKLTRLAPLAIILCAFTLASCANTVRGVGRDGAQSCVRPGHSAGCACGRDPLSQRRR